MSNNATKPEENPSSINNEHNVQLLISKLASAKSNKLEPVFGPEGYRYLVVDAILGDSSQTREFLERLHRTGILQRELYDKVVYCPFCESLQVSTRYCCPHCGTFDIRKSALMEHIACGYIETENRFRKDGKLVCPKCQKDLVKIDVDFHKAGIWCTCNQCHKKFDIPVPTHFCRTCNKQFTFDDAGYQNVYAYRLTDVARNAASIGPIDVAAISEFFRTRGFHVESPGFLKGKSGTDHKFDITALVKEAGSTEKIVVIDFARSTADVVSEQPVIAMFAKIYDISPDRACVITSPKMSENGKRLAQLYKIKLIEAQNQVDVEKALETCL